MLLDHLKHRLIGSDLGRRQTLHVADEKPELAQVPERQLADDMGMRKDLLIVQQVYSRTSGRPR